MSLGDGAGAPASGTPPAAAPASTPAATPPASSAPPPAAVGGAASGSAPAKSWRDALPDDMKSDPTLNKYSDITNLSKAHIELQKKFGEKGIFKPGKDASPEQIKAFREELGIPTDISKYELTFDKGVEVDPEVLDWARNAGVQHGIEPAALKEVMTSFMALEGKQEATLDGLLKADIKAGYDGLRAEWKDAFDRNIQRANFAAQKIEEKGGVPGLTERLKEYGADNDPLILKAFAHIATLYGEDTLREAGAGEGRQTPAELDGELASVRGQLLSLEKNDGRRPALLNRLESLSKQKTGGR